MFEFECVCGASFEKLIRKEGSATLPCPSCGKEAKKVVADFGFAFADGKVDGNSGVYSLDSSLDKRVGRDAQMSWEMYKDRFARKREVQRESQKSEESVALKLQNGDYVPMASKEVDHFRSLHKSYGEGLTQHREGRLSRGVGQHDQDPKKGS